MDLLKHMDDTTALLSVVFVAVYALSRYIKPQSLVHPLLLGRQADVGRVRLPGESAVYRNYATGIMGRLPERPKPDIKLVTDLVKDDLIVPRTLWSESISNVRLKERAAAFGAGLVEIAGMKPRESTALILLDDSLEFLITDLALASHSIVSFTLTSLNLLIPTLEKHAPTAIIVQASFLEHILEHVADVKQSAHHVIIVIGDEKGSSVANARRTGMRILRWEDLESGGMTKRALTLSPPDPHDIFTISFFEDTDGELRATQLSHANVIAGVTASRLLFPLAAPLSPSDSIFSAHTLGSAFGRAVAYTALYEGCNFVSFASRLQLEEGETPMSSEELQFLRVCQTSAVSATIVFITPDQLKRLVDAILKAARSNLLFRMAWRHKLAALLEGFITNTSLWDNLVFQGARSAVLRKAASTLRCVAVSGGRLDTVTWDKARIALSVPMVSVHAHPSVCGPVFSSHPLDLQSFPKNPEPHMNEVHVGPPATNLEVKLLGVLDQSVEKGEDPTGELVVRGPSVGRPVPLPVNPDPESWVALGEKARVQCNGTFKI